MADSRQYLENEIRPCIAVPLLLLICAGFFSASVLYCGADVYFVIYF